MILVYHHAGRVLAFPHNETAAHIERHVGRGATSAQVHRLSLVKLSACLSG
jgi:hypothetical protein